jgi:hypothetical protein
VSERGHIIKPSDELHRLSVNYDLFKGMAMAGNKHTDAWVEWRRRTRNKKTTRQVISQDRTGRVVDILRREQRRSFCREPRRSPVASRSDEQLPSPIVFAGR